MEVTFILTNYIRPVVCKFSINRPYIEKRYLLSLKSQ